MANCIAYCQGDGKRVHRLSKTSTEASAETWHTAAIGYVRADGSGFVQVERNGVVLHRFDFEKE